MGDTGKLLLHPNSDIKRAGCSVRFYKWIPPKIFSSKHSTSRFIICSGQTTFHIRLAMLTFASAAISVSSDKNVGNDRVSKWPCLQTATSVSLGHPGVRAVSIIICPMQIFFSGKHGGTAPCPAAKRTSWSVVNTNKGGTLAPLDGKQMAVTNTDDCY